MQALAAYKKAAELNPDNKEVSDKVRALNKMTRKSTGAGGKQVCFLTGIPAITFPNPLLLSVHLREPVLDPFFKCWHLQTCVAKGTPPLTSACLPVLYGFKGHRCVPSWSSLTLQSILCVRPSEAH
jgi:hypothetical protein